MKKNLTEILIKQSEKGNVFEDKLESISNDNDLNELINEYEIWDKDNCSILNGAIVAKQLFQMYSGVNYLRNVNIDPNSFQSKRDKLIYCLPKKMAHLNTAINLSQTLRNKDLLPLDEKLLQKINNQPIKNINMKKLFISHSSNDEKKIKPLLDLLESIGIVHNQIFYSSHPAYGVKLGENIFECLKRELSSDVFALFILSENFYSSPVCLCEMGAIWIKSNKQIPILIPPFDFKDAKGVFPNSLGFKINDKDQLNSFKIELENYFNLNPIHPSRWEEKRDDFLAKINSLL